jgi:hypothetical protein
LADYPDLLEYGEKIRRKAALQRMLRFASEENWEAFQEEVKAHQDLADHEQGIKKEAKVERMLRFASDLRVNCRTEEKKLLSDEAFKDYEELNAQDGIESALARVMPALTEATLGCFRRASGSDALPARNPELGYAMKGALVLSALAKAYDSHRDAIFKAQRDRRRES